MSMFRIGKFTGQGCRNYTVACSLRQVYCAPIYQNVDRLLLLFPLMAGSGVYKLSSLVSVFYVFLPQTMLIEYLLCTCILP